ncbi:MAG: carbohydrate porin, partial [bacterium]
SIFPNTAAALRVKFRASNSWAFQFAVLDAVPGTASEPLTPSLFLSRDDGALIVNEVAFSWRGLGERTIGHGTYTLGLWFYTASFSEIQAMANSGRSSRSTGDNGLYMLAEQNVFSEANDPAQGLALFARLGFANGRINQFDYNWSFGGAYTGLFVGRDSDVFSIGATYVNVSSEYRQAKHIAYNPIASGEMVIEFTYRARLTSWLDIQPDIQRIIYPGTSLVVENATVFGSRIQVGF